ncbi:MAG: hypothetical protein ACFFBH_11410 [Promethearchaeota archaeon]
MAVGITLYIISTILHYFGPNISSIAFIEGLLSGISVVFSIMGLFLFGKLKRSSFHASENEKLS